MKHVKIKIVLDDGAYMPTRATDGSVGYDVIGISAKLITLDDRIVPFTDYTEINQGVYVADANGDYQRIRSAFKRVVIDTGIHVQPADGYYVELVPNSRLAKTGLSYGNSFGVIDPDYTGSIKCILNISDTATTEDIESVAPGNVIGQLIIRKKYDAIFEQVEHLDATQRGDGGFGSTAGKEHPHE